MRRGALTRRGLLRAGLAAAVALPCLGAARPEGVGLRKAVFEEIGSSVVITLPLPGLVRRSDRDALASIDSGWDTTLEFFVDVWEYGTKAHVARRKIVRKIRLDPWKKKYVVRTKGASGWVTATFDDRAAAIEAATTLERVRVVSSSALVRGGDAGPFYFVTVLAMRNPLPDATTRRRKRRSSRRDRDFFGSLVDVLAGELPEAEEVVSVRTNPFYLLVK